MTVPDSKHTNNIIVGEAKVTVHGENHRELKEGPALCSWDSSCLLYAMIPVTNECDGGGKMSITRAAICNSQDLLNLSPRKYYRMKRF